MSPKGDRNFTTNLSTEAHKLQDKMRILYYNKISWFNPCERVLKHSFAKRYLAIYVLGKGFVIKFCSSYELQSLNKALYLIILVTTPAPTVFPPSRIANLCSSSRATGLSNLIFKSRLSPGIAISVPSGKVASPVTSVVRI